MNHEERREAITRTIQLGVAVLAIHHGDDARILSQNADAMAEASAQAAERDPAYAAVLDDILRPRSPEEYIRSGLAAIQQRIEEGPK